MSRAVYPKSDRSNITELSSVKILMSWYLIIVNGAVASVVQDMPEFKSSSNRGDVGVNSQYLLGNVGSTKIIVDPMILSILLDLTIFSISFF